MYQLQTQTDLVTIMKKQQFTTENTLIPLTHKEGLSDEAGQYQLSTSNRKGFCIVFFVPFNTITICNLS